MTYVDAPAAAIAVVDGNEKALHFQILGPLAVYRDGTALPLSGIRQRAILAYLLLRPNRVTATSQLISALWTGDAPLTARKMVQNAVWRIRNLLPAPDQEHSAGTVVLQSREPGYLLHVDPQALDLHRFRDLVTAGRERMRRGAVEQASQQWRRALALWRGPMLADLAEEGICWPELKATETERLDVLEDWFDAELSLGRHDSILSDLQAVARAEPRRERLAAQLMLALYRSGRHSQALDVYTTVRAELIDSLGLEPGRRLQELQYAILAHDATLLDTFGPERVEVLPAPAGPAAPIVEERKDISVALLRAVPAGDGGDDDPEEMAAAAAAVHTIVTAEAHRFGGVVTARVGSFWLIAFGARRVRDNDAMRAVLTVLAVRHRMAQQPGSQSRILVRAVVDSGEVLVRYARDDDAPPLVTGAALDRSHSVLPLVPPNEVWVGAPVASQTSSHVDYIPAAGQPAMARVAALRQAGPRPGRTILLERSAVMRRLLGAHDDEDTVLAIVTGDAGLGKTLLLSEFERSVLSRDLAARPLVAHIFPCTVDGSVLAVAAAELARCCAIRDDDPPELARAKLVTTVERVAAPDEAGRLVDQLQRLLGADSPATTTQVQGAWRTLLVRLAAERPVILVVDDLHAADEELLGFVDGLLETRDGGRLTVIAAARPELFERRPAWEAISATLVPLTPAAVAEQVRHVADGEDPAAEFVAATVALAEGNPLFAAEFAAAGEDGPVIPSPVYRVLAARLDALSDRHRSVLQDASALGEVVRADLVAAVHPRPGEVPGLLAELVTAGILTPMAGDGWVFGQPLLRQVAYARISHGRLAAMHTILAGRTGPDGSPLGPHRPVIRELIRWAAARPPEPR